MQPDPASTMLPRGRATPARQVLADHVYDVIMSALVDGSLSSDQTLNIDSLSRQYAVSPTPIREALVRLEATGLVVREALKGYRVAPLLTTEEVDELMQARALIEPENAFLTASRVDADTVLALANSIDSLVVATQRQGAEAMREYWQADEAFHWIIAEQSGNRFLRAAYRSLGGHVQRFRLFGGHGVTDAQDAIHEHREILLAVSAGTPETARDTMAEHIHRVRSRAIADALRNDV